MVRRPASGEWKRAVGEVLLIIVGVLVALWIESWRQARIDRATEIEYLERLKVDIDEDIADLDGLMAHIQMREDNARLALEFLDSDRTAGDASLLTAFNRAGFIDFFRHNRATMDDLLSTGNLALLTNKDLVRRLNSYYRSTDFLVEFDDQKKTWVWEAYRGSLDRHIPSYLFSGLEAEEVELSETGTVAWDTLRTDPEVRRGLGRVLSLANVERRHAVRILETARSLQEGVATEHSERTGGS